MIHVGKCGGSTVEQFLKKNNINFDVIHVQEAKFIGGRYVLVLRNPIERFISAFNWRYRLVVEEKTQSDRFPGEKEVLESYGSVQNLCENIHSFDINRTYVHHLKEDINFYLGDFLRHCTADNILGVITTENLNADLFHLFGIRNSIHLKHNKRDTILSNVQRDNLRAYLAKDYACIDKLHQLGVLSKEQYEILSK